MLATAPYSFFQFANLRQPGLFKRIPRVVGFWFDVSIISIACASSSTRDFFGAGAGATGAEGLGKSSATVSLTYANSSPEREKANYVLRVCADLQIPATTIFKTLL